MAKETAAQRVERIKKTKDGLDVLEDILHYAKTGQEIDPDDIDRFKWYGLYTQNKSLQADDDPTLYFMLRVKLLGGLVTDDQLKTLAKISRDFARDTADFTTRQDVQFHWIEVKNLPEIFDRLQRSGLTTQMAAGDCPRNIVSCPVNGLDPKESADVRYIVRQINQLFDQKKRLFSNLPRKFKISVCGCHKHCTNPEIHDLSFVATPNDRHSDIFSVMVGGGLAKNKRFATHIGYAYAHQLPEIAEAVAVIFRDYGNRENRTKARLRHLIDAWGIEHFKDVLENKILGYKLIKGLSHHLTPYPMRSHYGVHPSKEIGYNYIGCSVSTSGVGADGLFSLYEVLKRIGATAIRLTPTQDFIVTDVPEHKTVEAVSLLQEAGFTPFPSAFRSKTMACTGLKYCKFAISETKDRAEEIVKYLEKRFPDFKEPISISVNGCLNSCAHPHIVDIGLMGTIVKQDDVRHQGFELLFGGYLEGEDRSEFAVKSGIKVAPEDAAKAIGDIVEEYLGSNYISFRHYIKERFYEPETISAAS